MGRNSKNLKAAYEAIDRNKSYGLAEAVALIKGNAKAKFDETIEIAMNLNVDPRHADQMVRGRSDLLAPKRELPVRLRHKHHQKLQLR